MFTDELQRENSEVKKKHEKHCSRTIAREKSNENATEMNKTVWYIVCGHYHSLNIQRWTVEAESVECGVNGVQYNVLNACFRFNGGSQKIKQQNKRNEKILQYFQKQWISHTLHATHAISFTIFCAIADI